MIITAARPFHTRYIPPGCPHRTSTPIIVRSRRYLYCFYCSPGRFHPLLSLLYIYITYTHTRAQVLYYYYYYCYCYSLFFRRGARPEANIIDYVPRACVYVRCSRYYTRRCLRLKNTYARIIFYSPECYSRAPPGNI